MQTDHTTKSKEDAAMETTYGKRIYTKVNRPDRTLVEAFREFPSSNIADMMNRMYNMYGDLRCYKKDASMVRSCRVMTSIRILRPI